MFGAPVYPFWKPMKSPEFQPNDPQSPILEKASPAPASPAVGPGRRVGAEQYRPALQRPETSAVWERPPVVVGGPIAGRSAPAGPTETHVVELAAASLLAPIDFPAVGEAIVPGDTVALAVDPTVPQLAGVLTGLGRTLTSVGAGRLVVVLWEEASDSLVDQLQRVLDEAAGGWRDQVAAPVLDKPFTVQVVRHRPDSRGDLRYVAADDDAEPIYLARELVDADMAISVMAARREDAIAGADPTGIYPTFADLASQRRYQQSLASSRPSPFGWLLGIQLATLVSADAAGGVGRIVSGTPAALRDELATLHAVESDESEQSLTAELIVAALDGDAAAQSWDNIARAAVAAGRRVQPGGAIVIWSRVRQAPDPVWQRELTRPEDGPDDGRDSDPIGPEQDPTEADEESSSESSLTTQHSPGRRGGATNARALAQVCRDHRVWLHSELDRQDVEQWGLGVVDSIDELSHLAEQFPGAGVLRAAQFHAESVLRAEPFDEEDESRETH